MAGDLRAREEAAHGSLVNAVVRHSAHSKRRTRFNSGSAISVINFIGLAQATQDGGGESFSPLMGELV